MRALLSMAAAIHRELRGDGDSKHPLSPAPAPPPAPNASFTHWDPAGREAIERGSKHPCPHIIDAAQLLSSARCGITIASPLPGHMTELFHPFTSTTTSTSTATAASHTNPLSFTSLPASPLRLRLLLSAEPLSCAQPPGPSQASASRAHTPRTPACTRLATLVPLTLTRPPSRCTALPLPVATLGSRALLQIHPPFRQTCLLAYLPACFDCETLLPPLLRFRALRIPSSPSSHSGFARLHVHKRLLVLHLASLHLATPTPSRAPLLDLVTATRSSFEHP
ncbi:hypothetical protein Q7P35_005676 [Cladosporium inversicolor]